MTNNIKAIGTFPVRVDYFESFEVSGEVYMTKIVHDTWQSVMNHERNPLRHIPDLNTRHMVMQVLAWMWCIVFSMYFGSMWVFGITAIAHVFKLCANVINVATFVTAKRKPTLFLKKGYHTPSRSRYMYYKGKRIKYDDNDVGGEHE